MTDTYMKLFQVLPHPPILRGIETVVSTLRKNGHDVVEWTPYKHDYAVYLLYSIYTADGCADVRRDMDASGEPPIPNINDLLTYSSKAIDIPQLWDIQLQKWRYQCEYLDKWRELEEKLGKELDAIIAPVAPTAAIRNDQFRYYNYASAINLLDFTSVVVPVTFADKTIDAKKEGYKPLNDMDKVVQEECKHYITLRLSSMPMFAAWLTRSDYFSDDPEAYHGAPVAVQIIGRRLSEERTLAIAEEVGRLLGNAITP